MSLPHIIATNTLPEKTRTIHHKPRPPSPPHQSKPTPATRQSISPINKSLHTRRGDIMNRCLRTGTTQRWCYNEGLRTNMCSHQVSNTITPIPSSHQTTICRTRKPFFGQGSGFVPHPQVSTIPEREEGSHHQLRGEGKAHMFPHQKSQVLTIWRYCFSYLGSTRREIECVPSMWGKEMDGLLFQTFTPGVSKAAGVGRQI